MTKNKNMKYFAALAICLISVPFLALSAAAQVTRVSVTVTDQDGNPLKGVSAVATYAPQNFRQERETNKKGKAIFTFSESGVTYDLALELEGYNPANSQFKPQVGRVTYQTYSLVKLGATKQAMGMPTGETAELTPAQKAFNAGVLAGQEGDVATAKAKFEEALSLDANLFVAHSALAGIYLDEGNHQQALDSAQIVVTQDPGNPRGYRVLYEANRAIGNTEAAEEALLKLSELEKGADAAAMIFNEGAEALRVGDYKTGRERLEKALEMNPELTQAWSPLAVIYINDKDFGKAAQAAETLLAANPNDPKALKIRWEAYTGMGDEAKAKEAYDLLVAADPKVLTKELFEDGQKAFNGGDTETAIAKLEQLVAIDPEHAKSHYLLGLCYVNKGDNGKAKQFLQTFATLAPDDPDAATAKQMVQYLN
ncbi:MAG: tetratricopeptide repeat protein [Acidobacteriota bacterium]